MIIKVFPYTFRVTMVIDNIRGNIFFTKCLIIVLIQIELHEKSRKEKIQPLKYSLVKTSGFELYRTTWQVSKYSKIIRIFSFSKHLRGAFNKYPDFFIQAFKIVVDSWKFTMLLLYILWDDWPIFYDFRFKWTPIAGIGIHPTKAWLSQLANFWTWGHFRWTICNKILFQTWKNAPETYGMLQTTFGASCINGASVFE